MKTKNFQILTEKLERLTPHQGGLLLISSRKVGYVQAISTLIEHRIQATPYCMAERRNGWNVRNKSSKIKTCSTMQSNGRNSTDEKASSLCINNKRKRHIRLALYCKEKLNHGYP